MSGQWMEAVECGSARESQANNFKSPSALPAVAYRVVLAHGGVWGRVWAQLTNRITAAVLHQLLRGGPAPREKPGQTGRPTLTDTALRSGLIGLQFAGGLESNGK